jgi:hypothetical protein
MHFDILSFRKYSTAFVILIQFQQEGIISSKQKESSALEKLGLEVGNTFFSDFYHFSES